MKLKDLSEVRIPNLDVTLWRGPDGWHYDGPAGYGPKHVRTSGRGPYWRGGVSAMHVTVLRTKCRKLNIPVVES